MSSKYYSNTDCRFAEYLLDPLKHNYNYEFFFVKSWTFVLKCKKTAWRQCA